MSPYWGVTFFEFFGLFFQRLWGVISGQLSIAPDELQIFSLFFFGLSTVCVGVFLVLKRATMQANALSHTALLGIVLTVMMSGVGAGFQLSLAQLLGAATLTAIVTALSTHFLTKVVGLQKDASIGLIFTIFFALGVLLVTLFTRNMHIGVEAIMGNVDALHKNDLKVACAVFLVNLIMTLALFAWYKMGAFDRGFALSQGVKIGWLDFVLLMQTTLTIMAGFRAVGVILVLALMSAPVLIGRLFVYRLHTLFLVSGGVVSLLALVSVAFSRHLLSVTKVAVSTGGIAIVIICISFIVSQLGVRLWRKNWRY